MLGKSASHPHHHARTPGPAAYTHEREEYGSYDERYLATPRRLRRTASPRALRPSIYASMLPPPPDAHVKCLCTACYPLVLTTFPTPYPYHYPYPVLPELHSLYHIPQRRERVPPTALCCAVLRVLHVHPATNTS